MPINKTYQLFIILILFFCLTSCQNKTENFLINKWHCIQVENLAPINKNFISHEDSVITLKMEEALKVLNWTFNKNNTYQCSIGDRITTQGIYEVSNDEKSLTCTSLTKNTINNYTITSISEYELILTNTETSIPLIMHFRPD